jgi:type I restriction-modification system DNA methylase subunit/REP element-mobilizing transposase RayT
MTNQQQKAAAKQFVETWKGKGYEKGQCQPFWISLLRDVFGIEHPEVFIIFEQTVKLDHASFIDAMIPSTHVLIEQKGLDKSLRSPIRQSDGNFLSPFQQAKRYAADLSYSQRPRWIVTCNFGEFLIYDMENPNSEPTSILLENLEKDYYRLAFLVDEGNEKLLKEMEISLQAGDLVGLLYDALLKQYEHPDENSLKSLNALCVRLVFCLYAEDAGLFGKRTAFHDYLKGFNTQNIRTALIDLFRMLDTKPEQRDKYANPDLLGFPYVNGGLFADENIEIPRFTDEIVALILHNCSEDFDWSGISPTIFGAVFESTLNPETRRSGGMHYTSIENIHKVIDPLFMDDLIGKLEQIKAEKVTKKRMQLLRDFQDRLSSLTFMDPACGSGNFLTETFLSLRRLENEVIKMIYGEGLLMNFGDEHSVIKVTISQFYGIEINDFAVTVAKTALWIAESQMVKETADIIGHDMDFLPLKTYTNIHESDALTLDWQSVIPADQLSFIMGNPPFVGYTLQSQEQKKNILSVFVDENGKPYKSAGKVDFVAGWYYKASQMMKGTSIRAAFVSTNSICQGEQVSAIWKPIMERFGLHITFAYRTFRWDSEAKLKAHVHCVIVGFCCDNTNEAGSVGGDASGVTTPRQAAPLFIYSESGVPIPAAHINAYLMDAPDVFVDSRSKPICDVPEMNKGSIPVDGGNLLLSDEEYKILVDENPDIVKYIRPFLGAEEFLHNVNRWCLWLIGVSPNEINGISSIKKRVEAVKAFRLDSTKEATRKYADFPARFMELRQPTSSYLLFPRHSSESRRYVPIGFLSPDVICGDANLIIPSATLYHFGILTSNVHMAWMRAVCGRLEMRYRYSKDVVYNNFPWPTGKSPKEKTDKGVTTPFYDKNFGVELTQGKLPHWQQNGKLQFVTFHLADSLPQEKLEELKSQKANFEAENAQPDAETQRNYEKTVAENMEKWLDAGSGDCCLKFPMVRKIVEDALLHFNGEKYELHAYVVMPNHVHVLLGLLGENMLPDVLNCWKSYSAHEINKMLGTSGAVWHKESFDRMIRDEDHYQRVLNYIKNNPAKCLANSYSLCVMHESPFVDVTAPSVCDNKGYKVGGSVVPEDDEMVATITRTAQAILDARQLYPDSSLADLYDETTMPPELRKAHQENDRAVMRAYGFPKGMTETECVAELMRMYLELTRESGR